MNTPLNPKRIQKGIYLMVISGQVLEPKIRIVPLQSIEWGIWGSYYKIPKAIFYLLKGDDTPKPHAGYPAKAGPPS